MKIRSVVLFFMYFTAVNATAQTESLRKPFPVSRAELEFSALTAFPTGVGFGGQVDIRVYQALASPFGALDLQVTKAIDGEEASLLKNIYLGASGGILKIDTAKLAESFHCGTECFGQRKQFAVHRLSQVRQLVNAFSKAKNITIAAQGFHDERFRINNLFVLGAWAREAIPSPNMGFVPSGQWNEYKNIDEYFDKRQINRAEATHLISSLRSVSFAAIERSGSNNINTFGG